MSLDSFFSTKAPTKEKISKVRLQRRNVPILGRVV